MRSLLVGRRRLTLATGAALVVIVAGCTPVVRASVADDGTPGNGVSWFPSLSQDGRYVAFESGASNLVPGDTNGVTDIFVRDNVAKTVVRASLTSTGAQANGPSARPRIDDSGRYVAFLAKAPNLAGSASRDAYVRDMQTGVTQRVLASDTVDLDLAGSGRYVVTVSGQQVLVYDRTVHATDVIAGPAAQPTISDDGRYVAFTRPIGNGSEPPTGVFVRDLVSNTTTPVPFPAPSTSFPDFISGSDPQISGDGSYVAYTEQELVNLQPPDTFQYRNRVYVYGLQAGTLERADLVGDGTAGESDSVQDHAISDDGRDVMFRSSVRLVSGDANSGDDEYVRDRGAGQTYLVDRNAAEQVANDYSSYASAISGDGTRVAFSSQATNLAQPDTNGKIDVFVRSFPGAPPPAPPSTTTTVAVARLVPFAAPRPSAPG